MSGGPDALRDRGDGLDDVRWLARWLDTRFVLPGTSVRFGLDSLIGLIPGIGDSATAFIGLYILVRAFSLGAPPVLLIRMLINILIDMAVGVIPLLGDIFDFAFRSNAMNAALLAEHVERRPRP